MSDTEYPGEPSSKTREKIISLLKEYTGHGHVKLVPRGNAAIFAALHIAKKINPKPFILVPDQGGWISFRTYPQMLGFELRTVKTNRGIIDLIDLSKKVESGAALIMTSFAGYFAEQQMKYIYNICSEKSCILIEDVSGAVGDEKLCDGQYADIIVGSFGKWKIIDQGYGGFISVADKEFFDQGKHVFSMMNFNCDERELLNKIRDAPKRIKGLIAISERVKMELKDKNLKVLHPDCRGVNVIVRPMNEPEREDVREYCKKNKFPFVDCPKYIRVEEDAVSIELKRLHFDAKGKRLKS